MTKSERQERDNRCYDIMMLEKSKKQFGRIYAEFWVWAMGEGYRPAFGDFKRAWEAYMASEMQQWEKDLLFGATKANEIRAEFNEFCKKKIEIERLNVKKGS